MQISQKVPLLWTTACAAGFVAGMFNGPDSELSPKSVSECLNWALISFLFSLFGGLIVTLPDRMSINRRIRQAKLAGKMYSHNRFRWGFFGYCAWILTFMGLGMAVSSLWSAWHILFEGLDYFSAGIGLIISVKLAARILGDPKHG